jgi:hypothetical protein
MGFGRVVTAWPSSQVGGAYRVGLAHGGWSNVDGARGRCMPGAWAAQARPRSAR